MNGTPQHPYDDGIREHTSDAESSRGQLAHLYRTPRWKTTSKRVLRRDPFCKRCDRTPSKYADHIVPALVAVRQVIASGRWPHDKVYGFFLMTNLQGLCAPCHAIKTREDKGTATWPDVLEAYDAAPKKQYVF